MRKTDYYNCLNMSCLASSDDYKMPGFKRNAWSSRDMYGFHVKNVNTETRFRYVLHSNGSELFVELFTFESHLTPLIPVSMSILSRFLRGTIYENVLVEKDGHAFIKGMYNVFSGKRPSYDMCMNSNAYNMVRTYGDALAVMISFSDKIQNMQEAEKVALDLRTIGSFVDEMENPLSSIKMKIKRSEDNISLWKSRFDKIDKEMNNYHSTYMNAVQLLKKHNVELERKL